MYHAVSTIIQMRYAHPLFRLNNLVQANIPSTVRCNESASSSSRHPFHTNNDTTHNSSAHAMGRDAISIVLVLLTLSCCPSHSLSIYSIQFYSITMWFSYSLLSISLETTVLDSRLLAPCGLAITVNVWIVWSRLFDGLYSSLDLGNQTYLSHHMQMFETCVCYVLVAIVTN